MLSDRCRVFKDNICVGTYDVYQTIIAYIRYSYHLARTIMTEIKFETLENEPSAFNLYLEGKKIGEMIVEIREGDMTVFHTEVDPDQEGKGYAAQLLEAMTSYVRAHDLKVVPMCTYVHVQFDRHAEKYQDIRSKNESRF